MHYNISGTFRVGPTIMEQDADEVTLRRYAPSEAARDITVNAMNVLNAVTVVVEVVESARSNQH